MQKVGAFSHGAALMRRPIFWNAVGQGDGGRRRARALLPALLVLALLLVLGPRSCSGVTVEQKGDRSEAAASLGTRLTARRLLLGHRRLQSKTSAGRTEYCCGSRKCSDDDGRGEDRSNFGAYGCGHGQYPTSTFSCMSGGSCSICGSCPKGWFSPSGCSTSTCTACPFGWYQGVVQSSGCLQCAAGLYHAQTGRASAADCLPCGTGMEVGDSSTSPSPSSTASPTTTCWAFGQSPCWPTSLTDAL